MNQETIERAARAAYIEMEWPNRITEHDSNRRPDDEYKERAAKLWDEGNAGWSHYQRYSRQAAAVFAAIHPTVSSVAELDALELGTVVRDEQQETWELTDNGWRYWLYDECMESFQLALPATVIYTPGGAA